MVILPIFLQNGPMCAGGRQNSETDGYLQICMTDRYRGTKVEGRIRCTFCLYMDKTNYALRVHILSHAHIPL